MPSHERLPAPNARNAARRQPVYSRSGHGPARTGFDHDQPAPALLPLCTYFTGIEYAMEMEKDVACKRQVLDILMIFWDRRPLADSCGGPDALRPQSLVVRPFATRPRPTSSRS